MLRLTIFLAVTALACCAVPNKVAPVLDSPDDLAIQMSGFVGERLKANLERWELRTPGSNPALIEMFYDRDRKPDRKLLPWSGEFIGKYLCSSILSHRLLSDPRQTQLIGRLVRELIAAQGEDGYLGPFDKSSRLTGKNWDVWGHYWAIRALLLYDETFHSPEAVRAATRAADLIASTFMDSGRHMTNDGSAGQMNYAVIHAFTELHRLTGNPRYLAMANWIVKEWDLPGAGQYMKMALLGKKMFQFPGNRWESLHDFLGMYDMYLLTGETKFRQAFSTIWDSILEGDRHNTGGFTSGEQTTGNPYDPRAIETCCTVAWIDMSIDMLKLTGDSLVADELELATLNGNLGGQSPEGSWWTYNTPMDGVKEASAHTINFQCRPGSPDLNCCSVNGPRGVAMIWDWALLKSAEGLTLNYFGPATMRARTPSGQRVTIQQKTNYPAEPNVVVQISIDRPERFRLDLRVPSWSAKTSVRLNGEDVPDVRPGRYLTLVREWKRGDSIGMEFDFSPHYWAGEKDVGGLASIYQGPVLLAFDRVYNSMDSEAVPELDARSLSFQAAATQRQIRPLVLLKSRAVDGREVQLCDFATAGAYGNTYRTWLPIRHIDPIGFRRDRPVWANRP